MGRPKGCVAFRKGKKFPYTPHYGMRGNIPWNKGKVGVQKAWNKGIPCRPETKEKLRLVKLGKPSGKKGFKCSPETIEKIREARKRHTNIRGPKGKPWSLARIKAQELKTGKPYVKGERGTHKKRGPRKPVIKNGKEYHPLWHELRKLVYKRDGWLCQECGVHCSGKNKTAIACHHIDYDISNNDLSNLITLCASCHCKTNYRRENWIIHYKNKVERADT